MRTTWHDHDWQLIHEAPQAPSLHMALDEALTDAVASGQRLPTLRIWEWASPAVVIGRFQSLRNEVDSDAAQRHGIEVVRRISGGGAMFIEPGNTITYSLYAPTSLVEGLTFQGGLDRFWTEARAPDSAAVADFVAALANTIQLRGVYYKRPGLDAAVQAAARRLDASSGEHFAALMATHPAASGPATMQSDPSIQPSA